MERLAQFVKEAARRDAGQDLLEYALVISLIAVGAIGALTAAGLKVTEIFTTITNSM